MDTVGGLIALALIVLIAFMIYMLPFLIARDRKHTNLAAIFVFNLIFGCTIIGWIIALIWALINKPKVIVIQKDLNEFRE